MTLPAYLLALAEELMPYPPDRALAGRRSDELRVFLAAESRQNTIQFARHEGATVVRHGRDVTPPIKHRVEEGIPIGWSQIFFHRRREPVAMRNVAKAGQG